MRLWSIVRNKIDFSAVVVLGVAPVFFVMLLHTICNSNDVAEMLTIFCSDEISVNR